MLLLGLWKKPWADLIIFAKREDQKGGLGLEGSVLAG